MAYGGRWRGSQTRRAAWVFVAVRSIADLVAYQCPAPTF